MGSGILIDLSLKKLLLVIAGVNDSTVDKPYESYNAS